MNFFNIYNLPPLISSIIFLVLGFFVYSRNKKLATNLSFLLVCIATFWWQFSWFFLFSAQNESIINSLVKIGYAGIIFIPVVFYNFFVLFLERKNRLDKLSVHACYLIAIIFEIFLFSGSYFIDGFYKYFWGPYPRAGVLHPLYLLFLSIITLRIIYLIFQNLREKGDLSGYKYYQIKYLLIALGFYFLDASDFLVNYGIEFYPLGFIFILIFTAIITYAITRYRLMDIRFFIRKSAVAIFTVTSIVLVALIIGSVIKPVVPKEASMLPDIILVIISLIIYIPVRDFFYQLFNKHLFSSLYHPEVVYSDVMDGVFGNNNYRTLGDKMLIPLHKVLHLEKLAILDKDLNIIYNTNFDFENEESQKLLQASQGELLRLFTTANKDNNNNLAIKTKASDLIITEEYIHNHLLDPKAESLPLTKLFQQLKSSVLIPMIDEMNDNKFFGFMLIGPKISEDAYTNEDLEMLKKIASLAATMIKFCK